MSTGTTIAFVVCGALVLIFAGVMIACLIGRHWGAAWWAFVVALQAFTLPPQMERGATDKAVLTAVVLSLAFMACAEALKAARS